jgi:hypothetical protein
LGQILFPNSERTVFFEKICVNNSGQYALTITSLDLDLPLFAGG